MFGSLLDLPYAPFNFADFNVYPFTVINCNHEHKNSVCSVSSPNELSNFRVGTVPSELGSWYRGEDSLYTGPSLHSFTSKDQQLSAEWKLNFSLVTNCASRLLHHPLPFCLLALHLVALGPDLQLPMKK